MSGAFVISLDFELFWGVRDHVMLHTYRANLLGVRRVIPALLNLFREYDIHATWATVGLLFCENRDELMSMLPDRRPQYFRRELSPYGDLSRLGRNEEEDPFHFAPSLVRTISDAPGQEMASHTFSHYFCLEDGQDAESFRADLHAAVRVAASRGLELRSVVFPRNQVNTRYLPICREFGFVAYRGTECWAAYQPTRTNGNSAWRRSLRLVDSYLPLSGLNNSGPEQFGRETPYNLPSSRFLRPVNRRLAWFESLRLRRILSELTHAAESGRVFHLWWHPHNFGVRTDENLTLLRQILDHFSGLRQRHGMQSCTMAELAGRIAVADIT